GVKLDTFSVADMPLVEFANLMSEMMDLGITLDPHQLALAGVSPRQPVSVDMKSASVETLLRAALAKCRLDLTEHDGNVGVALTGADRKRAIEYDVADLAGGQDAAPIAELLERFVTPAAWTGDSLSAKGTKLR